MKVYGVVYLGDRVFYSNREITLILELVNDDGKFFWRASRDVDVYPVVNLTNQAIVLMWISCVSSKMMKITSGGRLPYLRFYNLSIFQSVWITKILLCWEATSSKNQFFLK